MFSIISFFNYKDDIINAFWVCYMIILAFWMNHDDFVGAWGFFQTKDWLRKKLAYPEKKVYYIAICTNILFRLSWVIGLSPAIFEHPLLKNLIPLITSLSLEDFLDRSNDLEFFSHGIPTLVERRKLFI